MKTKIIFFMMISILLLFGCINQGKISKPAPTPAPPTQKAENQPLVSWKQDNDLDLSVGDPIIFYNQYEILVVADSVAHLKRYKDGKFAQKDSTISYNYSIPKGTKGKSVNVIKKNGKPVSIIVEFDLGGENYQHTFNVDPETNFILSPAKKRIKDENGKEVYIKVAIIGDGSGKCRLMYLPEHEKSEQFSFGKPASGVPDELGIKVIKK
jgi:hypothetical protein